MKQTNSTVEQFKSFISSPPIIEELVWDLKVVPPGMKYNPEEGLGAFTNFQRLVARWQPNARSVYQIFPDYVSTNTVMNWFSISVYDKKHWQLTPSGFLIVWHDDGALPGPKAQLNLVKSGVDYLTYRLGEVLNMGVFNLGIGSIRWQGDIFSATNSNIGLRFHGALQLSPEGVPSHLNFRSEIATNNRALTVRYSFEHSTGVSFLPDQIRVTEDSNGRELERAMIRIRSIKLASQPASEEAFLPSTNLLSVPAQLRFYTNGAHYALNSNGRLVPSPLGARPPDVRDQRRIYLAVCAAVSLAIFALMVRAKLEKNKNETLRAELTKELT